MADLNIEDRTEYWVTYDGPDGGHVQHSTYPDAPTARKSLKYLREIPQFSHMRFRAHRVTVKRSATELGW